ncbi:MAG: DUF1499 domain-containing protein [Pirellulaceae bacterium]
MSRRLLVIVLMVGIGLPTMLLTVLSMTSTRPDNLGVTNGRLSVCPDLPNCVCTQASNQRHRIDPIPWTGSREEAFERIRQTLQQMPRVTMVSESEDYLHAESRSLIFRFVDDIEFLVDLENGLIHFRSASRTGYADLGTNRKRMERFRELFVPHSQ